MKKFNILLILIIFVGICNSQTKYFNKTIFPYSGSNNLRSILEMDSTYYVLGGNVDTPYLWFQTNFILNIDKSGDIINKKVWWDSLYSYSNTLNNSFIKTSDQNLVYVGAIKDTHNIISGYLVKLNKNLDTLWTRTFKHPDTLIASQPVADVYNVLTAIKQCWNGGYIIAGNYNKDCIAGNVRSYLLKTDSLGDMEWIKIFSNLSYIYNIEITSDSGFVFTDFQGGFHINKTNQSGDIIWREIPNNEMHLISGSVKVLSDGSYIVMAPYVYSHPFPNIYLYSANIIKYNNSGQLIWDKKYNLFHSFECITLSQSFNLEILPNDKIIVSGTSKVYEPLLSNSSEFKGVIMKLDQNGDSLWARYFGYGDFEDICQLNDIVLTDDGGFLGIGWHRHLQSGISWQNAWLVKLDSMGCDTPGCHTIGFAEIPKNKKQITIFPNPASYELKIEFSESMLQQNCILSVYNSVGIEVKSVEIPRKSKNYKLNIQDLHSGIYFIRIMSDKALIYKSKFVKL